MSFLVLPVDFTVSITQCGGVSASPDLSRKLSLMVVNLSFFSPELTLVPYVNTGFQTELRTFIYHKPVIESKSNWKYMPTNGPK